MCRGTYPLTPPLPFTPGRRRPASSPRWATGVDLEIGQRGHVRHHVLDWDTARSRRSVSSRPTPRSRPDGLTDAEAAGLLDPAPHRVDRARRPGPARRRRWLAVLGAAGGSGIAAVQLGRALGARVIAVVSDDERAAFCREPRGRGHHQPSRRPCRSGTPRRDRRQWRRRDLRPGRWVARRGGGRRWPRHGRLLSVGFASGAWPDPGARAGRRQHLLRRRVRRRLHAAPSSTRSTPAGRPGHWRADSATQSPPRSPSTIFPRPSNAWPTGPSSGSWCWSRESADDRADRTRPRRRRDRHRRGRDLRRVRSRRGQHAQRVGPARRVAGPALQPDRQQGCAARRHRRPAARRSGAARARR